MKTYFLFIRSLSKILTCSLIFLFLNLLGYSQPWVYDFGTATGSYSISGGASTSFLPTPSSGIARVRVGTNGGSFNLNNPGLTGFGTGTELNMLAPYSSSVNKFSIYDFTAGRSFYTRFFIRFDSGTSGNCYFFQGNGNCFSNSSAYSNSEIFTGIKWMFGSNKTITWNYRNGSTWSSIGSNPFSQSLTFKIEIYGNNTTGTISYMYNNCSSNSLAPDRWDIWVNGSLAGDDLLKAGLANNTDIDSWMFYTENSSLNPANVFIDDITYSNSIPQSVFEPVKQPLSLSFSNVSFNGFNLNFTAAGGNPDGYLILRKINSLPSGMPSDSHFYKTGDSIGDGIVAYSGSGCSFSDTSLFAGKRWYYSVFAYNGNQSCINYKANSPLQGSQATTGASYFTKSTGDIQLFSTWGTNQDGSGTSPSTFGNPDNFYYITNRSFATLSGNLSISGNNSKLIVGDGINQTEFSIPNSYTFTGKIDVFPHGKLTIQNTFLPDIAQLYPGSAVEYSASGIQNLASKTYYTLIISGNNVKTLTGNININDSFIINGSASINPLSHSIFYGTNASLIYIGTNFQTSTSIEFPAASGPRNLLIDNTSGVLLHDSRTLEGTLNIQNGNLDLNNKTLILNGNMTGKGVISGSDSSGLVIGGNGNFGNLSFSTNSIIKRTLNSLIINRSGGFIRLNSDLRIQGTLTITDGILDVGINSLDASTGRGNLVMTGGKLKLAKLNTILPELNGTFNLSGGTIEFYGNGNQFIHSNRTYHNLEISSLDTLKPGGGTINMNSGANLTISGTAVVDALNYSFCSGNVNFIMTGGRFRTAKVTSTQPEMSGTYNLSGGTVELYGTSSSQQQTIRSARTYFNIEINANSPNSLNSNVKQGSGNICIINEFRIKSNAVYSLTNDAITDCGTSSRFVMDSGATLKYGSSLGICATGNTGNIRTDIRIFPITCSYGVTGGINMVSGVGLPSACQNFYISKTGGKITLSNSLTSDNLIINTGSLEILPENYLRVNNTLINNAGNMGLVLKSSANGTASLIHQSNGVKGIVERFVPILAVPEYHYFSSPVDSASGQAILDSLFGNFDAYYYNPALGGNINSRWVKIFPSTLLNPGRGYIISYENPSDTSKTIVFNGVFNTGHINVPISSVTGDWNLIGNPYPCAVSAHDFIIENSINHPDINGTLYFWDDDASGGNGYSNSDYSCWNITGSTGNNQIPNGNIGSGQSFFVESRGGAGSVTFNNSMKSTNNIQFYIPENDRIQTIKLDLSGQGINNLILVGFLEPATPEADVLYDGKKLKGNSNLSFYSLIPGDSNEFAIQALPPLVAETTVELGFDARSAGNYSIQIKDIENLETWNVILEDKLRKEKTNLIKDTIYRFSTIAGSFKNRFVLHFIPENRLSGEIPENNNKIRLWHENNLIYIFSEDEILYDGKLAVHNVSGQEVWSGTVRDAKDKTVFELPLKPGFYIVTLQTANDIFIKKIIIKS